MKFQVKKSNAKRHRHHYNIKNSTTSDFKTVQPLFSRFLMPTSHVKGSVDQFVRMSPRKGVRCADADISSKLRPE